jgi:class 3 adenylate cyclase/CHASE3 domain sensor protein
VSGLAAWLPRLVARVPTTVHAKLLAAFLAIVVLLIVLGAVGLRVLIGTNRRAEELVQLQRKIAAYRQLQYDTLSQLYGVASALLVPDDPTLDATLEHLNKFGYDFDRLQFVARDEVELLDRIREDYERFVQVVTKVIELIRAGKRTEARNLQQAQVDPLADRLERLTNELVNRAETDMVASIEESQEAYVDSRRTVIGFALGSIGLALALGYALSWSLIGPVKQMDARLRQIAAGDFSQRVMVANRDELGTLAANLNRMNEELGRLYQQLGDWNRTLEQRVDEQVGQLERLSRLKRFFSPQLAELIVAGGAEDPLKTHRREVTVVFLDLRGFTRFAEAAEPEEVMSILHEYHARMGALILAHEGTLERFAGDGMMIFFNDPVPVPDHTERAIRMAVAMRDGATELSSAWRQRGHDLNVGIGIARGLATIGAIGFEGRGDYGAIGSVTNLAFRLCGEAQAGQILTTPRLLNTVAGLVEAEALGELPLKGFSRPVPTFNVLRLRSVAPSRF